VVIFVNDPLPAHVHVFGDSDAKINLGGPPRFPALAKSLVANLSAFGGSDIERPEADA